MRKITFTQIRRNHALRLAMIPTDASEVDLHFPTMAIFDPEERQCLAFCCTVIIAQKRYRFQLVGVFPNQSKVSDCPFDANSHVLQTIHTSLVRHWATLRLNLPSTSRRRSVQPSESHTDRAKTRWTPTTRLRSHLETITSTLKNEMRPLFVCQCPKRTDDVTGQTPNGVAGQGGNNAATSTTTFDSRRRNFQH